MLLSAATALARLACRGMLAQSSSVTSMDDSSSPVIISLLLPMAGSGNYFTFEIISSQMRAISFFVSSRIFSIPSCFGSDTVFDNCYMLTF